MVPYRKLGSYWGFVLAVGWLITGIGLAQDAGKPTLESQPVAEPRQEDRGSHGNADANAEGPKASELLPAIRGIESAIRNLIPEKDEAESNRQNKQDADDLQAQQDMAVWAKGMFWATIGTIITTVMGLVLIWRTLHHTRRAADYAADMVAEAQNTTNAAIEGTRAAIEANRLQNELFAADQRPWIEIEAVVPDGDLIWWLDDRICRINVGLVVKNCGKTVATDVNTKIKCGIGGFACLEELTALKRIGWPIDPHIDGAPIFPNQQKAFRHGINTEPGAIDAEAERFFAGFKQPPEDAWHCDLHISITFYVYVSYRSLFSEKLHQTSAIYNIHRKDILKIGPFFGNVAKIDLQFERDAFGDAAD